MAPPDVAEEGKTESGVGTIQHPNLKAAADDYVKDMFGGGKEGE